MFSSFHAGFGVISIWACGFECSSVVGAPLRNFLPTHPPHSGGFSPMPIRSLYRSPVWGILAVRDGCACHAGLMCPDNPKSKRHLLPPSKEKE